MGFLLPPEGSEPAGAGAPDLIERAGVLVATLVCAALLVWGIDGLRGGELDAARELAWSAIAVGSGCVWLSLLISLRNPTPLAHLGFTPAPPLTVLWGCAGILGLSHGLDSLLVWVAPAGSPGLDATRATLSSAPPEALPILLASIAGLSPLGEELLFRGTIQRALGRAGFRGVAVFASSLLFGLAHGDWIYGGVAFALGVALGVLVLSSGSLLPALFAHTLNNLVAVLEARGSLSVPALFEDPSLGMPLGIGAGVVCLHLALRESDGRDP